MVKSQEFIITTKRLCLWLSRYNRWLEKHTAKFCNNSDNNSNNKIEETDGTHLHIMLE